MSTEAARLIFFATMAAGGLVWVISLIVALRLGREVEDAGGWSSQRFSSPELDSTGPVETGERIVRGDPEKLSKEIVRALLQGHLGGTSLFEVIERTARRVVLKKTGPLVVNQPPGLYFSEAEFELDALGGDKIRVRYTLGFARLARRMRGIALGIIGGIGLPVLVAVGVLIWIFVLQSDEETVRWQVLQTLHIGHALWPPFLFLWMHRLGRRHSKTFVANLLTTLEYVD